jgi:hypothetical protein
MNVIADVPQATSSEPEPPSVTYTGAYVIALALSSNNYAKHPIEGCEDRYTCKGIYVVVRYPTEPKCAKALPNRSQEHVGDIAVKWPRWNV